MYEKEIIKINLCNDAMFKSLFTSIEARNVVIGFLNAITGIDEEILRKAEFQGGDIPKKNKKEKGKISDVIVKLDDKNRIIVEMNAHYNDNIFNKNTDYALSMMTRTTGPNGVYSRVILINIDDFNKYNTKKCITHFQIRDEEGNIESILYNSIHLILENLVNEMYNKDVDERIIEFGKFLKSSDLEEMKKIYGKDGEYMAMVRKVEDLTQDPDFIRYYDLEEAHKQDIEDTLKTGISQGLEQGISQSKIEIAKNMLNKQISPETISECTGLSIEEIEKLK